MKTSTAVIVGVVGLGVIGLGAYALYKYSEAQKLKAAQGVVQSVAKAAGDAAASIGARVPSSLTTPSIYDDTPAGIQTF